MESSGLPVVMHRNSRVTDAGFRNVRTAVVQEPAGKDAALRGCLCNLYLIRSESCD